MHLALCISFTVGLLVKGCVVHPSIHHPVRWSLSPGSWLSCGMDYRHFRQLAAMSTGTARAIRRNTLTDLIGPCKNWMEADPRGAATLVWLVWANEWTGGPMWRTETFWPINNVPKPNSLFQIVQILSNRYARTLGIVLLRGVTL